MSSINYQNTTQFLGISAAYLLAGGNAALSYYAIPILIDGKTDLGSLQKLRKLFSSGSHILPQVAILSTGCFAYLAKNNQTRDLYIAAAASTIAIGPFTTQYMVPTCNGYIIEAGKKGARGVAEVGGEEGLKDLFRRFALQNWIRVGMLAAGGSIGLYTALTEAL